MIYAAVDPGVHGAFAVIGIENWSEMGLANTDFQVQSLEAGILIWDMPTYKEAKANGKHKSQYDPGVMYSIAMTIKDLGSINGGLTMNIENIAQAPKVPSKGSTYARGGFGDFSSGECRGIFRAVMAIASIPYEWLIPRTWRGHYKLRGGSDHKADGIPIAKRIFPEVANDLKRVSIDHNRADALLMANYLKQVKAWEKMGAFR